MLYSECHALSLSASGRQIRRYLVQAQTCTHASSLSPGWSACLNPDAIDVKHSLIALRSSQSQCLHVLHTTKLIAIDSLSPISDTFHLLEQSHLCFCCGIYWTW